MSELSAESARSRRRRIIRRVVGLVAALVVLYLFAPSIAEVLSAWPRLAHLDPFWLVASVLAEVASFTCVWWLLSLALRSRNFFAIATSQLAANGLSCVVPAGAAAGATLQYRMLAASGVDNAAAGSALTAVTLLQLATLSAIPVLSLILSLLGQPISHGLQEAAWFGLGAFVVLMAVGAVLVLSDHAVSLVARVIQSVRNRVLRHHIRDFPRRLRDQRDLVRQSLGERWVTALLATVGKWAFDYAALLASLAAVGARPNPGLVLLAYGAGAVLGMIPITPGGLGFVEAGLTGVLALAGVSAGDAVLATLNYRLVSFWIPLPSGLVAYALFRRRYRAELKPA